MEWVLLCMQNVNLCLIYTDNFSIEAASASVLWQPVRTQCSDASAIVNLWWMGTQEIIKQRQGDRNPLEEVVERWLFSYPWIFTWSGVDNSGPPALLSRFSLCMPEFRKGENFFKKLKFRFSVCSNPHPICLWDMEEWRRDITSVWKVKRCYDLIGRTSVVMAKVIKLSELPVTPEYPCNKSRQMQRNDQEPLTGQHEWTWQSRYDQKCWTIKVLLLSNECAFWKVIPFVFCLLFIFIFQLWTNKNVIFLYHNILGFLSWLWYPVPTFTRAASFSPTNEELPLLKAILFAFCRVALSLYRIPRVSVLLSSGTIPAIWPWGTLQGQWIMSCPFQRLGPPALTFFISYSGTTLLVSQASRNKTSPW